MPLRLGKNKKVVGQFNNSIKFGRIWGKDHREMAEGNINIYEYICNIIEINFQSWTDFKYNIKKKASERKRDLAATGGGPLQN